MNDRYARGLARQAELRDGADERRAAYDLLADTAPDLPRPAVEFAYGDVHARDGLDAARRELVILGALVALGDTRPQLRAHTSATLAAGLCPEEIVEAVMQVVPYAGFPRVFTAMTAVREVFADRGLLPVGHDRPGREPPPKRTPATR
ncbi:carboxymuconolactone decarboxylase family protein [Actinomadura kijaniata]|uniref:carboxymuconolactone decarboxylase family protein n=1 Tax=Actinomadura kijaniata TaxID=46161 RepID=UPI00082D2F84|nr:carboxymuconolactone decarboxylase family protein [Actinomadura kijaniata]